MIVGIYLTIPIFSAIKEVFGRRTILIITIILFIWTAIIPLSKIKIIADFSYFGDSYVFYILFGYCCNLYKIELKSLLKKWSLAIIFTLFVAMFIYCIKEQFDSYQSGIVYKIWYTNPLLIITSILLFPCFTIFSKKSIVMFILSMYAFSIYLIHNVILRILTEMTQYEENISYCFLFFISSFILSIIIAMILSKSKKISKILFLINK